MGIISFARLRSVTEPYGPGDSKYAAGQRLLPRVIGAWDHALRTMWSSIENLPRPVSRSCGTMGCGGLRSQGNSGLGNRASLFLSPDTSLLRVEELAALCSRRKHTMLVQAEGLVSINPIAASTGLSADSLTFAKSLTINSFITNRMPGPRRHRC
jgi:hypothetical protein